MNLYDRDTADFIRILSEEEAEAYLAKIGDDPIGFVDREFFDPGETGVVYAA